MTTQSETRITKPFASGQYAEQRSVQVEQVIAPDGLPAVVVRAWKTTRHAGKDMQPECVRTDVLRFPAAQPGIAVGQWADKQVRCRAAQCRPNTDQATYQDYFAWSDAFECVYSES